MHPYHGKRAVAERDPLIATAHREPRACRAESVFDPSYERATAALRRWVDGMEAALARGASGKAKEVLR